MTEIWGHRGAKGYRPENTLISFEEAWSQGADGIELDVHLSKDGCLMVCHDERVDRTSNGIGLIKDMTYSELRKLDFGSWFDKNYENTRIPTLNEVLDFVKDTNLVLNVEIKAGSIFYPDIEEKLIQTLDSYNMRERTIISSFDHYALVKIKDIDDSYRTGMLYEARLYKAVSYMKTLKADALHSYFITVTEELIAEAFQGGAQINTYTVNSMNVAKKLKALGVNAIITDYPKDAVSAIR